MQCKFRLYDNMNQICKRVLSCLRGVRLFVNPWTVTHQAPPSAEFPGKNTGVGGRALLQGIFQTRGGHCNYTYIPSLLDTGVCIFQSNSHNHPALPFPTGSTRPFSVSVSLFPPCKQVQREPQRSFKEKICSEVTILL